MKKDVNATGIALGVTFGALSIICLLALLISQSYAIKLFNSITHGVDWAKIAITPSLGLNTLIGLIVVIVGGYLFGVLFAATYNKFAKQ